MDISGDTHPNITAKPKKKPRIGRKSFFFKSTKVKSHKTGNPCGCKQKCFNVIKKDKQDFLIQRFNSMGPKNEQDSYLSCLITPCPVKRRRSRKNGSALKYEYCVYKLKNVKHFNHSVL